MIDKHIYGFPIWLYTLFVKSVFDFANLYLGKYNSSDRLQLDCYKMKTNLCHYRW